MIYLYFDTETCDYSEEESPSLPCEVGFILAEENRILSVFSSILDQRGWEGIRENPIADRVIAKHGITPEVCRTFGDPPEAMLHLFRRLLAKADAVVAHNIEFDLIVMDHAYRTQRLPPPAWPSRVCTMHLAAPILRIPARGRFHIGGCKAPRLGEAYRWFSGKPLVGAHGALADVNACRLVHRGILRHQRGEPVGPGSSTPGESNDNSPKEGTSPDAGAAGSVEHRPPEDAGPGQVGAQSGDLPGQGGGSLDAAV